MASEGTTLTERSGSDASAEIRRMFAHAALTCGVWCAFIVIIEPLFIGNLWLETYKVCLIDLADFEVMRAERLVCCETTGESIQDFPPEASWQEKRA